MFPPSNNPACFICKRTNYDFAKRFSRSDYVYCSLPCMKIHTAEILQKKKQAETKSPLTAPKFCGSDGGGCC